MTLLPIPEGVTVTADHCTGRYVSKRPFFTTDPRSIFTISSWEMWESMAYLGNSSLLQGNELRFALEFHTVQSIVCSARLTDCRPCQNAALDATATNGSSSSPAGAVVR